MGKEPAKLKICPKLCTVFGLTERCSVFVVNVSAYRQLTEKYQQLLRKYERESKANKRLSMDKEELMWRLSQGDPASDTPRRSLSHSPTCDINASEAPSPSPSSSLRPTSAVVLRPKKNTLSVQRSANQSVNLRRSGTYDLINQDIDESADSVFECPAD